MMMFSPSFTFYVTTSHNIKHRIDLVPDYAIPNHRIYRMSPLEEKEPQAQLKDYLENNQIEPSHSPFLWSSLF